MLFKNKIAVFDVDETIIKTKSIFSFYKFFLEHEKDDAKHLLFDNFKNKLDKMLLKGASRDEVNSVFYNEYSGVPVKHLDSLGCKWFAYNAYCNKFWNIDILREFYVLNKTHITVLLSGSTKACLKPLKDHIGADHLLCTKQEEEGGNYSGMLIGEPCIGRGKEKALTGLLKGMPNISYCDSVAYGDHQTDIEYMSLMDKKYFVNPTLELKEFADENNWGCVYE
jgi:HAD superfamily hydrolase (TIGR01490 family)|tara:strand:- start:48352 stop:49023 length:672 start_codon:yes stop_codon:yes gene_type:complete